MGRARLQTREGFAGDSVRRAVRKKRSGLARTGSNGRAGSRPRRRHKKTGRAPLCPACIKSTDVPP